MYYLYTTQDKKAAYVMNLQSRLPVSEVMKFLTFIQNSAKSNNTEISYAKELLKWYNFCDLHSVDQLSVFDKNMDTLSVINQFMKTEILKGNCHKTVNHALSVVYEYYDFLAASRIIEAGPTQQFSSSIKKYNAGFLKGLVNSGDQKAISHQMYMSSDPADPVNYIDWDEYKRMLTYCRHPREKLLTGLLFENGLRIGEALGIHIEDIDLEDRTIHLVYRKDNENNAYVKRHSERDIVLSDNMSGVLLSLLYELQDVNPKFLFVNMYRGSVGSPMQYANAYKLIKRIGEKAGIKMHPHMLRHGFGMVRLNDPDNPWQVAEISRAMGHTSIESTKIYATATEETVRRKSKDYLKKAYQARNKEDESAEHNKKYN